MKTCTGCQEQQPLDQFHRFKYGKDGRAARCKDCARERNRLDHQRRQENRSGRDEVELAQLHPTKTCARCKIEQPRNRFNRFAASKDGVTSECKDCTAVRNRSYRERNREHLLELKRKRYQAYPAGAQEISRAWKESNPERHKFLQRRSHLKNMYGMTPEQYDAMLDMQDGKCAICTQPPGDRLLHIDHDHSCCPGKKSCGRCIRGLLCAACNAKLGWLENYWPTIANFATSRIVKGTSA